jgi:flagellar biosynthesis protein FlhF
MKVKRYRAEDRATALKQIRAELGADAVIVAENRVRTGGVFGMFGRVEVEILAALEERTPVSRAPAPAPRAATPSGGRPGEVEATISAAARRVAAANPPAATRASMDGAGRLAAILEQLPRTGGSVSPEMTSRLADLLAQGGQAQGGGVAGASSGGALPSPRPPAAPSPGSSGQSAAAARGGAIGPSSPTANRQAPFVTEDATRAVGADETLTLDEVAESRPGDNSAGMPREFQPEPAQASVRQPEASPSGGGFGAPRAVGAMGSQVVAPLVPPPAPVPAPSAPQSAPSAPQSAPSAPQSAPSAPQSGPAASLAGEAGAPNGFRDMQHTLSDLRASVERLMRQQQTQLWPRDLPVVRTIYQHLISQELDGQLSLEVVGQVSDEVNEGKGTDPAAVMRRVRELIAERIQVGRIAPKPSGPTVIVLVGPTGVGKTTTLAKLAAHLSMQENRRVALVTTDTFRIAAASQLGTYADLMELPLEVAYSPDELREAVDRQSDADYILVDSPGCAQRNDAQIRELSGFVETLPGATVLLTVSATVKLRDLIDVQDGFSVLPVGGLVLTKLDETTVFGPVMSLVARSASKDVPVYYMTSGQNVPTDLEEASRERLTDLVVGQLLDQAVTNLVGKGGPPRELVGVGDAR